jgi:hypothetical protein
MTEDEIDDYLPRTRALVNEGRHAEALARYMWFHDNILEHRPSMSGLRHAAAVTEWFDFGEVYPPARAAFVAVRDRDRARLLEGEGGPMLFHDVVGFNQAIDGHSGLVDLLDAVSQEHPKLAAACWPMAWEAVAQARRIDLFEALMPETTVILKAVTAVYAHSLEKLAPGDAGNQTYRESTEEFMFRIKHLAAAARAMGREDDAKLVEKAGAAALESGTSA